MPKPEKEAEEEEEGKGRYEIGKAAGACTSFCGTETNRPYGEREGCCDPEALEES